MAVNKVDYDVLNNATTVYANQASGLDEIINALIKMNGDIQDSCSNETLRAFNERFESDHKIALQNARDSIQEISNYIKEYVAKHQEEDLAGANAVSG